ncbi:MAG: tetratricopeptide repeat protein [Bacteroidetes bacterium]|nr:tetratricopeptide repeat protein [Bacteroidota bacterium]
MKKEKALTLLLILFSLCGFAEKLHARKSGQDLIDSLNTELQRQKEDTNKVNLLVDLSRQSMLISLYDSSLEYALQAKNLSESLNYSDGIANSCNGIAVAYANLSDYSKALEYYQIALKIHEQEVNKSGIARILNNMALAYLNLADYHKALEYQFKALKINEELDNKRTIRMNLGNIGIAYERLTDYHRALEYSQKALYLSEQTGDTRDMAINLGNIGLAYRNLEDYPNALRNYQQALSNFKLAGDKRGIAANLRSIGEWYLNAPDSFLRWMKINPVNRFTIARQYADSALILNKMIGRIGGLQENSELLSQIYEKEGKYDKAFEAYKDFIIFRDSVQGEKVKNQITRHEMQYEFDKKEAITVAEIQKQRLLRNGFIAGSILFLLLALSVFIGLKRTLKEKKITEELRVQSDNLLHNILPEETATELKLTGSAKAKSYDNITVLFTDFVGFTTISEQLTPTELVQELHTCFTAFDQIIEKHRLEKIKTIGDAYLAVCGLPKPHNKHAQNTVNAALEIRDFMVQRKQKANTFEIRIGIHSGSVVAGIVGVKKFAYDIWGDTVNTAARMEQRSEAGKINLSENTYLLVKDDFDCEYRGEIEAKNKGKLKMYFVGNAVITNEAEPVLNSIL